MAENKGPVKPAEDNPLYCPWFVDTLMNEYIPFAPLWTSMMLRVKEPADEPRMTNNDIEQWMGQVKNIIWEKKSRIRPLWAIRKLHTSITGRLRHHRIEINVNRKRKKMISKSPSNTKSKYFRRNKRQPQKTKSNTTRHAKQKRPEKDVTQLEEIWKKTPPRKGQPKYFTHKVGTSRISSEYVPSLPWSGCYKNVHMTDTCPVDNFLMAFHIIFSRRNDIANEIKALDDSLGEFSTACKTLVKVHEHFGNEDFQRGRYLWLTSVCGMKPNDGSISVWGTQTERFINHVIPIQESFADNICSSDECLHQKRKIKNKLIVLS